MAHGAGGKASRRLVEGLFAPLFSVRLIRALGDAAHVDIGGATRRHHHRQFRRQPAALPRRLHRRTRRQRHGERPRRFRRARPGDGRQLRARGRPARLTSSKPKSAPWPTPPERAGVTIVGGDTKVVEHGKADGMYITTAGIGTLHCRASHVDARSVRPGDKVLLSGPIGDHGITILLARGDLDLEADLRSDTRSVLPLVEALVAARRSGHSLDARSYARRRRDLPQRARARLRTLRRIERRRNSPAG